MPFDRRLRRFMRIPGVFSGALYGNSNFEFQGLRGEFKFAAVKLRSFTSGKRFSIRCYDTPHFIFQARPRPTMMLNFGWAQCAMIQPSDASQWGATQWGVCFFCVTCIWRTEMQRALILTKQTSDLREGMCLICVACMRARFYQINVAHPPSVPPTPQRSA